MQTILKCFGNKDSLPGFEFNALSIISKIIKCASPDKHKHRAGQSKLGCSNSCTLERRCQGELRLLRAVQNPSRTFPSVESLLDGV